MVSKFGQRKTSLSWGGKECRKSLAFYGSYFLKSSVQGGGASLRDSTPLAPLSFPPTDTYLFSGVTFPFGRRRRTDRLSSFCRPGIPGSCVSTHQSLYYEFAPRSASLVRKPLSFLPARSSAVPIWWLILAGVAPDLPGCLSASASFPEPFAQIPL